MANEDALKAEWEEFKQLFNKTYSSEDEESSRFKKFCANKMSIEEHNKKYTNGDVSYSLGLNALSDMDHEEYVKHASCLQVHENDEATTYEPPADVDVASLPKNVDWREQGYVTPVRDQGPTCGSCYAFSAMGALESHTFKKTKKLVSLSPQNIIDCSTSQGNAGCKGGWPFKCYMYVQQNKGVDTEKSYPYRGADGTCAFKKDGVGATVTNMTMIKKGSEAHLQIAVATVGPVSVGIDASKESFHHYKDGVYDDPECSYPPTHAVVIVGYGEKHGKKYWIVKNSWGDKWGDKGYVYMSRDKKNQCAIASFAVFPIV